MGGGRSETIGPDEQTYVTPRETAPPKDTTETIAYLIAEDPVLSAAGESQVQAMIRLHQRLIQQKSAGTGPSQTKASPKPASTEPTQMGVVQGQSVTYTISQPAMGAVNINAVTPPVLRRGIKQQWRHPSCRTTRAMEIPRCYCHVCVCALTLHQCCLTWHLHF